MAIFRRSAEEAELAAVAVRPATAGDAADVVRLARGLSLSDGGRPSQMTEQAFREDGFGADPAFEVLVAELNDNIVGYALFFTGYDSDRASRGIYLSDLYVDIAWRRHGVGRALMKAGGAWMFWSVLKRNREARRFYRTLAPELKDVVLCAALGPAFEKLAR
jgi:ribosomal protein S18 acetylase RimI-like enzyme